MFGGALMGANAGLFVLYVAVERTFSIFGLSTEARVLLYLAGVPLSFLYCLGHLRRIFEKVQAPSIWHSLTTSLRMMLIQGASIAVVYFILKDVQVSRAFMLSYLPAGLLLNWLFLYFAPRLVCTLFFNPQNTARAILYGHGAIPDELRSYIKRAKAMGIQFIGYYADQQLQLPEIEWLGETGDVLYCEGGRKKLRADLVFAWADDMLQPGFREGIDKCVRAGARIHLFSNLSGAFPDPVRVISDGHMVFLTFYDEPLQNPLNVIVKRLIDVAIALPTCLLILPPLALVVKIGQMAQSPGPLLFKQTRYGMSRKPFTIFKFRTMHVHDRSLEAQQACKGDARIYPLGALLRKTSLDEFPQFLNVLRGEMSVVGPRPHLTLHDDQFEKHFRRYRSRHYVKPGITGLAQVSGYRGETSSTEAIVGRVQHDLAYITQWSVSREIYIVLKTAWQVLFPPKSAY